MNKDLEISLFARETGYANWTLDNSKITLIISLI